MKQIYIICGPNGAGKGTAIGYLRDRLNAPVFSPSDLTKELLEIWNIPVTRTHLSKMLEGLRDIFGPDILVTGAYHWIGSHEASNYLFDGIRKVHLIEKIREQYPTKIIFIESGGITRYARIASRGEKENEINMSYEEFLDEEDLLSENDVGDIRNMADIIIENNGTKEEFFVKMDIFLKTQH